MLDLKDKNILFSTILGEYSDIFKEKFKNRFKNAEFIEGFVPYSQKKLFHIKAFRELHKAFPKVRFLKKLYDKVASTEYKKIINSYEINFDYFLVVSAGKFTEGFIKELKKKNPNVKTVLFLYDKLSYTSWGEHIQAFDYVFTFDRNDHKKYGYFFRPTFYTGINLEKEIEFKKRDYSLYYVGYLRDVTRYYFAEKLSNYLEKNNLNYLIKLFAHKKRKFNILPKNYKKELITAKRIEFYDDLENTRNTKVILDLSYGEQIGLTLRCLNAIESNTKILTNNKDIINYDFYNEKNIKIVENIEEIEQIDPKFFVEEPEKIPENIKYRYSIDGFIDEIIEKVENVEEN